MFSTFIGEMSASLVVYIQEITQDGFKGVSGIPNPTVSRADILRFVVGCGTEVIEFASFNSLSH